MKKEIVLLSWGGCGCCSHVPLVSLSWTFSSITSRSCTPVPVPPFNSCFHCVFKFLCVHSSVVWYCLCYTHSFAYWFTIWLPSVVFFKQLLFYLLWICLYHLSWNYTLQWSFPPVFLFFVFSSTVLHCFPQHLGALCGFDNIWGLTLNAF